METKVSKSVIAKFKKLRAKFLTSKITRQEYIEQYFNLGKLNGLILYHPIC